MTAPTRYKKRLEGIQSTRQLDQLLEECYKVLTNNGTKLVGNKADNLDENTYSYARELPGQVDAGQILLLHKASGNTNLLLPIRVIQAMQVVLSSSNQVENALNGARLAFTAPPPNDELTDEQKRHKKRIEKLKLKQEESQYGKLTSNLGKVREDDVTTRSMTYAASIGLNMIIAPISFGGFMYFFAGGLLDYFFPNDVDTQRRIASTVDVRKVITGVVSGVLMLFVEMILFVIRTHEMEKAMLIKQRKSKNIQTPFGVYTANSVKTFKDE